MATSSTGDLPENTKTEVTEGVTKGPEEKVVKAAPDDTSEEKTVSDEKSEQPEAPEKAAKTPGKKDLSDEEIEKLSDKAQKRFHKLSKEAKRAKELEEENRRLKEMQEANYTGKKPVPEAGSRPTVSRLPWEDKLAKGESVELTPEDYKRDVTRTADQLVQIRLAQAEKAAKIKEDLVDVQSKHDVLNPESDTYDKELDTKLAELFQNQLRANPNTRLLDFVNSVMEVRSKGKEEGQESATATLAKQKAEEALTPSDEGPTAKGEVKFEDLSLEEQEKFLKDRGLWE